ncbi:MAG: glycosyltransferase family 32 protein, partial [Thomasclavelia spiroformis]
MIPHIIHLCWFGKGDYPELAIKCINSWKKYLPNYDIKIWNEETFDINSNEYTKQAYEQKKWAFISDYVRLYALEHYGGVYMDTDLEVIKDFSSLLDSHDFVSSTLEGGLITAGFISAIPHHPYIKTLKEKYDNGYFKNKDGKIEYIMNPLLFTKVAERMYGFKIGNDKFECDKSLIIYPMEYFMPYRKSLFGTDKYSQNKYLITNNTYAIHHDMGSWGKEK